MQQLQACHPSTIQVGDRIRHAGVPVRVNNVEQINWRTWRIDFTYEYDGGVTWVYYPDAGPFSNVQRYIAHAAA